MQEPAGYRGPEPLSPRERAYQDPVFLNLIDTVSFATGLDSERALDALGLTIAALRPHLPEDQRLRWESKLPQALTPLLQRMKDRSLDDVTCEMTHRFRCSLTEAQRIPLIVQDVLEQHLQSQPDFD